MNEMMLLVMLFMYGYVVMILLLLKLVCLVNDLDVEVLRIFFCKIMFYRYVILRSCFYMIVYLFCVFFINEFYFNFIGIEG